MKPRFSLSMLLLGAACLAATGCDHFPGKPGPEPEVPRPEHVLDFTTLYSENCASCHGEHGTQGPSIALANPVYLAVAGEANVRNAIAKGVPGSLMPAFAQSSGGMLTDQQVAVLAHGLVTTWGKPDALAAADAPSYHATTQASVPDGEKVFGTYCARCHGEGGVGRVRPGKAAQGSIVDPAFLGLVSDQYLRTVVIAGIPGRGMPNWANQKLPSGDKHPLTDAEITSVVAWLGSHRGATSATHPQTVSQTQPQPGPQSQPQAAEQSEPK
ncbi:MAG TPA: c-type cytochrome [Granulicella sp.]|jgi:mono/diheme cytochrome c family protein|nr:c-type cytochrome [Granulicella sp.]